MPRLYMDVHVPAAVTDALRRREVDVLTSQEDGARETEDEPLLSRATTLGRVLVSQDNGFHRIAAEWQELERPFVGIVFAPQGIGIGRFIGDLELIAVAATDDEVMNRLVRIPLS